MKKMRNLRRTFLLVILILFLGTGLWAAPKGGGDGSGGGYMFPLSLDSSTLRRNAVNVELRPEIKLSFSKNIAHMSVREANKSYVYILDSKGKKIDSLVYIADDQVEPDKRRDLTITPKEDLRPGARYTLVVEKGVKSKSDFNLEDEVRIDFTTRSGFTDLTGHWGRSSIESAVAKGLMVGTSSTSFSPNKKVTRGELAALMSRTLNLAKGPSLKGAKDYSNSWYLEDMEKAISAGLMSLKDGRLAGDDYVSREELAGILKKALNYKKIPTKESPVSFKDRNKISSGYLKDIDSVYNLGLMKGDQDFNFNPKSNLTRAEMAVVLNKLVDKIK